MEGWAYPRTWLDFETIAFPVPRWRGTRPYQPMPFQFSAHIEQSNGDIEHQEFLRLDGTDPRRPFNIDLQASPIRARANKRWPERVAASSHCFMSLGSEEAGQASGHVTIS